MRGGVYDHTTTAMQGNWAPSFPPSRPGVGLGCKGPCDTMLGTWDGRMIEFPFMIQILRADAFLVSIGWSAAVDSRQKTVDRVFRTGVVWSSLHHPGHVSFRRWDLRQHPSTACCSLLGHLLLHLLCYLLYHLLFYLLRSTIHIYYSYLLCYLRCHVLYHILLISAQLCIVLCTVLSTALSTVLSTVVSTVSYIVLSTVLSNLLSTAPCTVDYLDCGLSECYMMTPPNISRI